MPKEKNQIKSFDTKTIIAMIIMTQNMIHRF